MIADRSRPRLLILGCSTRAAAWSAVRGGFFPVCADQFGDMDLRQVAEVLPLDRYPHSIPEIIGCTTAAGWMYVGGMENHSKILSRVQGSRHCIGPLLGCAPDRLESIRSPLNLQAAAVHASLKRLAIAGDNLDRPFWMETLRASIALRASKNSPLPPRMWFLKNRNGSGGQHVRLFDPDDHVQTQWIFQHQNSVYFQEYTDGKDLSAVFIANPNDVELIGVTRQLIGDPNSSSPEPYGYCGNIGPISMTDELTSGIRIAVNFLRERTRLRGLIGIDFKWHDGQISLLEINPRYTASCEILELALRRPLLTDHWRACLPAGDPPPLPLPVTPRCGAAPPVLGKMIVYAREAVVAPDFSRFLKPRSPWTVPFLADIPQIGTRFERGQPVCTVFASGADYDTCYSKLVRRVRKVRRWLSERASPENSSTPRE